MDDLRTVKRKVKALRDYFASELYQEVSGSYQHGVYSGKVSACYDIELMLEHHAQERERNGTSKES